MAKQRRKGDGLMSKMTNKDKYAIQYLVDAGKNVDFISSELGLSKSQIKRFLTTLQKEQPKQDENAKTDKTKDVMIRQTSSKKNNTVSIMTQGASQIGDEFYKNMNASNKNTDSYIYRRP